VLLSSEEHGGRCRLHRPISWLEARTADLGGGCFVGGWEAFILINLVEWDSE
jgi:hypothetical protein